MAGVVTVVEKTRGALKEVRWVWVSATSGAADLVTTNKYTGTIVAAYQIPDGGGTQPTAAYDVTITNADSVDVLAGLGADLSQSAMTTKTYKDGLGSMVDSTLTLNVTNAGDAKGGKTIIYIQSGE
jgi:hypothetical protein